jgi:hypothetical protein
VLAGKRIECVAVAVVAAGFVLAGCGGGGGGSTSTTTGGEQLTKQELIAQGDSICRQANDKFGQLQQNPPTTPESAVTFTQNLIDIQESQLAQLRELNPPSSLRSSLDDYLKALEKNIAVLKQGLAAAQQNDATGYADAQAKTVQGQVQRLELARAVGFKECSRPAGTAPGTAGG